VSFAWALSLLLAQQPGGDAASYRKQIEAWRAERVDKLKADGGWLTVAGLFWLKPGRNRFGAERGNDITLPASAPGRAGAFVVEGGRVRVEVEPGVTITLGGKPVSPAPLKTDAGGAAPDVLVMGPLTLQIIDRGGRLAVRLKDMQSAARKGWKGTAWYPVNPAYRVNARFEPRPTPTTIAVPTVIGTVEPMPSPGTAWFELGGKTLRLDPVLEPGETQLFFIIRDATSGHATYGGGRFLYADPAKDGHVVLDFNKAYAPPCAFTPYATCPLPPAVNRLGIAVEAGELAPPH
jgi:uncharacterized protein (DUF1684 family)